MSIDGVSGKTSYIGMSILNLRSQLGDLQTQLASGRVSTTYAGQGVNRSFALGLRAQISTIDAYADTATNLNTRINVANLTLQGLVKIGSQVKSAASTSTIVLNNNGQTSGQITAQAAFANAVSVLNTQSGERFLTVGHDRKRKAGGGSEDLRSTEGAGMVCMITPRQSTQAPLCR